MVLALVQKWLGCRSGSGSLREDWVAVMSSVESWTGREQDSRSGFGLDLVSLTGTVPGFALMEKRQVESKTSGCLQADRLKV
jgi:hypothetical protein